MKLISILLLSLTLSLFAGTPVSVRWTGAEDKNADTLHILEVIRNKTGVAISSDDLMLIESRTLATSEFLMLTQLKANLPVKGRVIRIWKTIPFRKPMISSKLFEN